MHYNACFHSSSHAVGEWLYIYIHAGMDRFSHVSVFLHCSNNNRASTGLEHFQNAVVEWELPSRVRCSCDKGGENTEVAWFMLSHPRRGTGRGSVIAGKGVHNQSIERLWQDVYKGVLRIYSITCTWRIWTCLIQRTIAFFFVCITYSSHK